MSFVLVDVWFVCFSKKLNLCVGNTYVYQM